MRFELGIRYFGTSAFEIVSEGGRHILIDPCITGWNGRNVSPVPLDDIRDIDLVLISHAAPDHYGDALELMRRTEAQAICDPAVHYMLVDSGIDPARVHATAWGMVRESAGIVVRCVESKHVSCTTYKGSLVTGMPNGYMVTTETGRTVYHPGDTAIFSDLKLFAELYKPEIGLLPVGGFPGLLAEMSPEEAALAAKWMALRTALPMHYAMDSDEPARFAAAVRRLAPHTDVIAPHPGEWLQLPLRTVEA